MCVWPCAGRRGRERRRARRRRRLPRPLCVTLRAAAAQQRRFCSVCPLGPGGAAGCEGQVPAWGWRRGRRAPPTRHAPRRAAGRGYSWRAPPPEPGCAARVRVPAARARSAGSSPGQRAGEGGGPGSLEAVEACPPGSLPPSSSPVSSPRARPGDSASADSGRAKSPARCVALCSCP